MEKWVCSCCGQSHTGLPLSFAADFPDTLNLRMTLHIQALGQRPLFVIDEPHLLAEQQRKGISWELAREMAERALHYGGLPDQMTT